MSFSRHLAGQGDGSYPALFGDSAGRRGRGGCECAWLSETLREELCSGHEEAGQIHSNLAVASVFRRRG